MIMAGLICCVGQLWCQDNNTVHSDDVYVCCEAERGVQLLLTCASVSADERSGASSESDVGSDEETDAGKGKHSMPASSMEKYVPPAARGRTGSSAQGMGPCSRSCMECASNSRVQV